MKKIKSRNLAEVLNTPTHQDLKEFEHDVKHQQAVDRLTKFNNHYYFPYLQGCITPAFGEPYYKQWLESFELMGLCGDGNSTREQKTIITSPSGWEINRGCLIQFKGQLTACEWFAMSLEEPTAPYLLATARAKILGLNQVIIVKLMEIGVGHDLLEMTPDLLLKIDAKLAYFNCPKL